MRVSQLFFQTLRTIPAEGRFPGGQLMARAGLLRPLSAQEVALLPLGVRVRRRIEAIIATALEAAGAQEAALPEPSSAALLAMARGVLQSHRQLPAWLYVIGANPARCVDLYGLHAEGAELSLAAGSLRAILAGIVDRCDAQAALAVADLTPDGRPSAHAFVFPWEAGDVELLRCPACRYAALTTAARSGARAPGAEPLLPLEAVATPGCKTIAELADFLGIPSARTAKAVMWMAEPGEPDERFIFAVVRGDTDLNEAALRRVVAARRLAPAAEADIRRIGAEPGYASPVGLSHVTVIVDRLAARSANLVAGANRAGYHLLNVNCGRDFQPTVVAEIALACPGDACPECTAPLEAMRGMELGRVELPGDGPAAASGVTYLDREGIARPVLLSHARIYPDRLAGAVAETHHDEKGLVWPAALAPFGVYLMTAGKATPDVLAAADALYAALGRAGLDVLYDDRDERAGVKFNDADLLGIPVRVVLGERGLRDGFVEVKLRRTAEVELVSLEELPGRLAAEGSARR